jgi:hypothetical protein
MTNQIDSMENFMGQHTSLMQSRPIRLQPYLERTMSTRGDFFRLHDGFERVSDLYREFQRNYVSREGPLSTEECQSLYGILEEAIRLGIGDVDGLFTPLNRAADEHSARSSRPSMAREMASYHLLSTEARQAYEERLVQMLSQLRRGQEENYEIDLSESDFPQELWRLHVQPENFFRRLSRVIDLEGVAPYVDENITAFERVRVINPQGNFVTGGFGENLAERFRAEYPDSYRISVVNPSIESFRSTLPPDFLSVAERFDGQDDISRSMRDLPSRINFGSNLNQAYRNGYQRDILRT